MRYELANKRSLALSDFITEMMAVYHRDLMIELRSRWFFGDVLIYPLILLAVIGTTIGGFDFGSLNRQVVHSSMIWIILVLAATPNMGHSFDRENTAGTMDLLRLTAKARPLFIEKLLFNMSVLFILELAVVPLYSVFMNVTIYRPSEYTLLMLLGSIGLGSTTTLISALAAKDKSSNTLVSMLSIPLLLPLLIVLVKGGLRFSTSASTTGWIEIKLAAFYAFMMTVISVIIFPKFWEEGRS